MRLDHILLIVRHELAVERRAAEVVGLVTPFALAALLVLPIALGIDQATTSRVGFAAFWMISLLFGGQIAWRQATGHVRAVTDQIRLSGIDPASAFFGRFLANLILLVLLMTISLLGTIVLFSPPPIAAGHWLGAGVFLFAIGLAVIATVISDLTIGLRSRGAIAALLVGPLAIPLVIAAAQVGQAATVSGQFGPGGILTWVLVLVLIDLIGIIAGVLTARPLEETLG
ncbi:MAG: heme exporter protein CcmB [Acidimicrobiia bacterium]